MRAETADPGAAALDPGDGLELVFERELAAPREAVFRAWTESSHFARWFGPHGTTLPFCRLDARPGGRLHYLHRLPDGEEVWIGGVYDELVPPERIAFTVWFADETGARRERPGFPRKMRIAVEFAEHGAGTRMTARHTGLVVDQGEVQGWTESLERLSAFLETM